MQRETVDIFIAGGGPAGLIAAAAFAHAGASVLLADPGPPPGPGRARDLRSTAFLHPARALFDAIGLWDELAPKATDLRALRIVDLAGDPPAIRTERSFQGADLAGDQAAAPLGWNFMNDDIRAAVLTHLGRQPGVELAWGCGFAGLVDRSAEALVTLTDGRRLSARLAVAADGRASPLREAAGIAVQTTRYGQKALAFAVTHALPHDGISTELYLDGGPFTIVPLPDHDGAPASAVVWMNPGPRAVALAGLTPEAFGRRDHPSQRRRAGADAAGLATGDLAGGDAKGAAADRGTGGADRRGGACAAADRGAGAEHQRQRHRRAGAADPCRPRRPGRTGDAGGLRACPPARYRRPRHRHRPLQPRHPLARRRGPGPAPHRPGRGA